MKNKSNEAFIDSIYQVGIDNIYRLGAAILLVALIIFTFLPHHYQVNKVGIFSTSIAAALLVLTRKKVHQFFPLNHRSLVFLWVLISILVTSLLVFFSGAIFSPFFFLYFLAIIAITLRFGSNLLWLPLISSLTSVIVQFLHQTMLQFGTILDPHNLITAIIQIFSLILVSFFLYFLIKCEEKDHLQLSHKMLELDEERSKVNALVAAMGSIDDGVLLINRQRRVIAWNKAMENLTDLSEKDVLGNNIDSMLKVYAEGGQRILLQSPAKQNNQESSGGLIHHQLEAYVNKKVLHVDCVSVPLFNPQGKIFALIEIFQNAARDRKLQMISELAQIIKSIPNFEETLEMITRRITHFCKAQKALIFVYNDEGELVKSATYGFSEEEKNQFRKLLLYTNVYYPSSKKDERFFTNNASQDPRIENQIVKTFNIKRYLRYQLKLHGKLIGTLAIFNKKNDFSSVDFEYLDSISGQIATIIENSKLYDDLKKSIVRERQFIADVAHELKTPLTALRNEAELTLARRRTNQIYQETLASILESVNSLSTRLKNVLDLTWTMVETDKKRLQPVDLANIVAEVEEITEKLGTEKKIKVEGKLDGPLLVKGDKDRLAQALINLADNAVKFTPKNGQITFKVWPEANLAKIQIADTGLGICKEELPFIFDRFYRGTTKTKELGSGLGLAITKSIITAHQGRIEAKSKAGRGSTFTITLPLS